MEPQVRYVRSADGTRLAVWTLGHGRALVNPQSHWFTSMESFWNIPEERAGIEEVAKRRLVVRFDGRGFGLSDRNVDDFSIEARTADLAAVIDSVGDQPVDLIATGNSAVTAITFAARQPTRVRRLILWNAVSRGSEIRESETGRALRQLIQTDWDTYVRTQAALLWGWNAVGLAVGEASLHSVTPESYMASVRALRGWDVTEFLPQIHCPTLLLYRRNNPNTSLDAVRQVASVLPNARLVVIDDPVILAFGGPARAIMEDFLDDDEAPPNPMPASSGTATILFADVVDSTALTARMGNEGFRERTRVLEDALRRVIRDAGGSPVEGRTLGDGVLGDFNSAAQAIAAALQCEQHAERVGLQLHLGIHAGDVIREPGGSVSGIAVSIAARISDLTEPNEILVSSTVRDLARTSASVTFEDRGEHALKGVGEPQRVYAVRANSRG